MLSVQRVCSLCLLYWETKMFMGYINSLPTHNALWSLVAHDRMEMQIVTVLTLFGKRYMRIFEPPDRAERRKECFTWQKKKKNIVRVLAEFHAFYQVPVFDNNLVADEEPSKEAACRGALRQTTVYSLLSSHVVRGYCDKRLARNAGGLLRTQSSDINLSTTTYCGFRIGSARPNSVLSELCSHLEPSQLSAS